MKLAVIGATGTIGSKVAAALEARGHDVIRASRSSETAVDLDSPASIDAFYAAHPDLDGVVSVAGNAAFGPVQQLDDAGWQTCLDSKLMGQVNLVRKGAVALPAGRFVLTSGILSRSPWPGSAAVAMVNGGLESFARAAALDMPQASVTVVSPPLVRESAVAMGMGEQGPPAADVARLYVQAVESAESGSTLLLG